jgi:catechol 2,3-dioxygenase-like lactoylglutathione lyase family enzyme
MRLSAAAIAVATILLAWVPAPSAQDVKAEPVARYLFQPSMNVFRRFAVDRAKMLEFYGDVLGLNKARSIQLGRNEMSQFLVGTSLIKLTAVTQNGKYTAGPIREVTGLRVFTFFFPDEAALTARFVAHGLPAPQFKAATGGTRVAMVQDPDGQYTELVVMPTGTPASAFDRIEVGITVSNLQKSRAFYREFVGLEELPPVDEPILGVKTYPYRHGTTTINLWEGGTAVGANGAPRANTALRADTALPANTASAGIQYVTSNVDAVDVQAKLRGVQIDQPLGNTLATLRTIWLGDPDGVTNYFAETPQSRAARATTN